MAFFGDLVSNIKGLFWEQVNLDGYVFDAYLRMDNVESITATKNPVESGSNITDHAYVNPKIFHFDIGMTDTSLGKVFGQFGFIDRPVNAYRLLSYWLNERKLITLNGKYGFYRNVLVTSINAHDDYTTNEALKVSITLEEVLVTSTQLVKVSAASFYTSHVNRGLQNATSVSQNASVLSYFN